MGLIDALCIFDWISPLVQLTEIAGGRKALTVTGGPAGRPVMEAIRLLKRSGVRVGPTPIWQEGTGLLLTVDKPWLARKILSRCGYSTD